MGAQAMSTTHHGSGAVSSRQGSMCSLAVSEGEGQLHGVNLDDLLRTGGGSAAGRKTVDEVWRDIQGGATASNGFLRQPAASGQMTLDDFLSRAGADSGSGGARWGHHSNNNHHHHNVGRPVPRPLGVGAGPVLDALYHDGGPVSGRKRAGGEGAAVEKTVERRKKRMIKNRESAARSRARKQAYTNELENKISRLEEENKRLRMHKAPEPVVQYVPQQEPKNQLRRVNSADF